MKESNNAYFHQIIILIFFHKKIKCYSPMIMVLFKDLSSNRMVVLLIVLFRCSFYWINFIVPLVKSRWVLTLLILLNLFCVQNILCSVIYVLHFYNEIIYTTYDKYERNEDENWNNKRFWVIKLTIQLWEDFLRIWLRKKFLKYNREMVI